MNDHQQLFNFLRRTGSTSHGSAAPSLSDSQVSRKRTSHESNFFVTINSNKRAISQEQIDTWHTVISTVFDRQNRLQLYEYLEGTEEDIMSSHAEFVTELGTPERGLKLHSHAIVLTKHKCRVRLNAGVIAEFIKAELGKEWYPGMTRPYVQVKLAPSTDWAEKIMEYMDK